MAMKNFTRAIIVTGIAVVFGLIFWIIDGILNFYFFRDYLRFMLFERPETVLDAVLLNLSPYAIFVRISFLIACIIGGVLTAVFLNKQKKSEKKIIALNEELEERVVERTLELEKVNKELRDFAYIVSHDLKAPLRAVNQLSGWIAEDYGECLDKEGKEKLELLSDRVRRMHAMIDAILQYSRIGRTREEEQEIDVHELVNQVVDSIAPPDHVRILIEGQLPRLKTERTRLEHIFQNLLDNAVKFTEKEAGEIRIGCNDRGRFHEFYVSDNGCGIEPKYHARIFQIFQALNPREHSESTGIGLTLVKKMVETMEGAIRLESEPGKGSSFYFTLPKRGNI